jgi:predicted nuclease of predicted toxin-antitoxin system
VGYEALPTSELPDGNRTSDQQVADRVDRDGRIVVTKDGDFRDGHLLAGSPRRLLVVVTGNISNTALFALFTANITVVAAGFDEADFVELGAGALVVHRRRGAHSES